MVASDPIDPVQARRLRGLGHGLRASVQVGREGLTEAVLRAAGEALVARELIKVRFGHGFEGDPKAAAERLAGALGAVLIQRIGRVALLWRARREDRRGEDGPRPSEARSECELPPPPEAPGG